MIKQYVNRLAIEGAAKIHARANKSDPFAYKRIKHHMKQGYEEPEIVFEEAKNILIARGDNFLEYGK